MVPESLGQIQGAIIAISHDRAFLNAICESILEIRNRKLNRYRGNYDDYLGQKAARNEQQWAAYRNQQREIAELQRFIDRFRAKASKASQAQDRIKQLDRMVKIEAPEPEEATVSFSFPSPNAPGSASSRSKASVRPTAPMSSTNASISRWSVGSAPCWSAPMARANRPCSRSSPECFRWMPGQ